MSSIKTRIGEIRYNPTEERFEALVSLFFEDFIVKIAADVPALVTADFDQISNGLMDDAMAKLLSPSSMKSVTPRDVSAQFNASYLDRIAAANRLVA